MFCCLAPQWIFAYLFLEESLVKVAPSAYEAINDTGDEIEQHELLGPTPASSYPAGARLLPFRSHMRSPSVVWAAFRKATASGARSSAPSKDAWPAGRLLSLPAIRRCVSASTAVEQALC